jgi:hypothetical protein
MRKASGPEAYWEFWRQGREEAGNGRSENDDAVRHFSRLERDEAEKKKRRKK